MSHKKIISSFKYSSSLSKKELKNKILDLEGLLKENNDVINFDFQPIFNLLYKYLTDLGEKTDICSYTRSNLHIRAAQYLILSARCRNDYFNSNEIKSLRYSYSNALTLRSEINNFFRDISPDKDALRDSIIWLNKTLIDLYSPNPHPIEIIPNKIISIVEHEDLDYIFL